MDRVERTLVGLGMLVVATLAVAGCAPLAVGGLVGGTAVAASEERGIGGFVSDIEIQAQINKLWFEYSVDLQTRLDMTVDLGRVLLTGKAKDAQQRLDAVRLAWQAHGVKEVINEIKIDEGKSSLLDDAKDTWISTQIRGRITFDLAIKSQNYTIDTVDRVVYLMGIAKDQTELDAVLQVARSVPGVQRVVNYVRLGPALLPAAPSPERRAGISDPNGVPMTLVPASPRPQTP